MSEQATTARKRSSSSSASDEPAVVTDYDAALEAGYIGGPIDEADHTVAGEIAAAAEAKESSG